MKLTAKSILFFGSVSALFAHAGHGFFDDGIAHYISSFIHSAPILVAAIALFIWAKKKIRQTNS